MKWRYDRRSCTSNEINFISRLIPVTGKDVLDKLVSSQLVGLHSSVGRALQG